MGGACSKPLVQQQEQHLKQHAACDRGSTRAPPANGAGAATPDQAQQQHPALIRVLQQQPGEPTSAHNSGSNVCSSGSSHVAAPGSSSSFASSSGSGLGGQQQQHKQPHHRQPGAAATCQAVAPHGSSCGDSTTVTAAAAAAGSSAALSSFSLPVVPPVPVAFCPCCPPPAAAAAAGGGDGGSSAPAATNSDGDDAAAAAAAAADAEQQQRHPLGEAPGPGLAHVPFFSGPPRPPCEEDRLLDEERVMATCLKQAQPRRQLENILKLVRSIFGVSTALVALFGDRRVFVLSQNSDVTGMTEGDFAWRWSLCGWTMASEHHTVMVIPDTLADARFADNHFAQAAGVRFYAGCPLVSARGHRLGTLCFADGAPRVFDASSLQVLMNLSELVTRELESEVLAAQRAARLAQAADESHYQWLLRSVESVSSAVLLVDTADPAWPVLHASSGWEALGQQLAAAAAAVAAAAARATEAAVAARLAAAAGGGRGGGGLDQQQQQEQQLLVIGGRGGASGDWSDDPGSSGSSGGGGLGCQDLAAAAAAAAAAVGPAPGCCCCCDDGNSNVCVCCCDAGGAAEQANAAAAAAAAAARVVGASLWSLLDAGCLSLRGEEEAASGGSTGGSSSGGFHSLSIGSSSSSSNARTVREQMLAQVRLSESFTVTAAKLSHTFGGRRVELACRCAGFSTVQGAVGICLPPGAPDRAELAAAAAALSNSAGGSGARIAPSTTPCASLYFITVRLLPSTRATPAAAAAAAAANTTPTAAAAAGKGAGGAHKASGGALAAAPASQASAARLAPVATSAAAAPSGPRPDDSPRDASDSSSLVVPVVDVVDCPQFSAADGLVGAHDVTLADVLLQHASNGSSASSSRGGAARSGGSVQQQQQQQLPSLTPDSAASTGYGGWPVTVEATNQQHQRGMHLMAAAGATAAAAAAAAASSDAAGGAGAAVASHVTRAGPRASRLAGLVCGSIDGLTLGGQVAAGSYGRVYRGTYFGSKVAVKVLDAPDVLRRDAATGLALEALLGAGLKHPGLLATHAWAVVAGKGQLPARVQVWGQTLDGPHKPSMAANRAAAAAAGAGGGSGSGGAAAGGSGSSGSGSLPRDSLDGWAPPGRQQQATAAPAAGSGTGSSASSGTYVLGGSTGTGGSTGSIRAPQAGVLDSGISAAAAARALGAAAGVSAHSGGRHQQQLGGRQAAAGSGAGTPGTGTPRAAEAQQQPSGGPSPGALPAAAAAADDEFDDEFDGDGDGGGDNELLAAGQYWLVLEYADRGCLQDAVDRGWLRRRPSCLEPRVNLPAVLATAAEVAGGMAHLHAAGVIHGDLSPWNVLLSSSDPGAVLGGRGWVAKVADFGLSRTLTHASSRVVTKTYGTLTHQPPEMLLHGVSSKAADVYSFGVLLWQMVAGSRPWAGLSHAAVVDAVAVRGEKLRFPPQTPEALAMLGAACMEREPAGRPSFQDVLDVLAPCCAELAAAAEGWGW